jgi:hypothetical protein
VQGLLHENPPSLFLSPLSPCLPITSFRAVLSLRVTEYLFCRLSWEGAERAAKKKEAREPLFWQPCFLGGKNEKESQINIRFLV